MLGEFCGSHPQPPISASRPVAARRTVRVLRFLFGNWYARAYLLVLSGLAFSPRDPEHQRDQDGHGTNAPEKITLSSKPGSRSANSLTSG